MTRLCLKGILASVLWLAWLLGTPARAQSPERLGWAKNCAVILGMAGAVAGSIESRERAAAHGDYLFNANPVVEGASHLLGPISLNFRWMRRFNEGSSPGEAARQTLVYDYAYLLGYAALHAGLVRLNRKVREIRFDDFERASHAVMGPPPARVLLIESFAVNDELATFPTFYRIKRYNKPGQAESKFVWDLDMLTETLTRLERQVKSGEIKPFDRVEIHMHGHPNRLQFANGTFADTDRIKTAFAGRHFDITNAGADLRFVSCSIAGGCRSEAGAQHLIREMGRAILPRGGTVLGAPRNIIVSDGRWSWENFQSSPEDTSVKREAHKQLAYLVGVKAVRELFTLALGGQRNYQESQLEIIAIDIPASPDVKP